MKNRHAIYYCSNPACIRSHDRIWHGYMSDEPPDLILCQECGWNAYRPEFKRRLLRSAFKRIDENTEAWLAAEFAVLDPARIYLLSKEGRPRDITARFRSTAAAAPAI